MIYGLFILSLFYVIGHLLSSITGQLIPGSVIGMTLLFFSLIFRIVNPEKIKKTAQALTSNMALFFVPVGVGIMASFNLIADNLIAILIASLLSTLAVIISVAYAQQNFERWKR